MSIESILHIPRTQAIKEGWDPSLIDPITSELKRLGFQRRLIRSLWQTSGEIKRRSVRERDDSLTERLGRRCESLEPSASCVKESSLPRLGESYLFGIKRIVQSAW